MRERKRKRKKRERERDFTVQTQRHIRSRKELFFSLRGGRFRHVEGPLEWKFANEIEWPRYIYIYRTKITHITCTRLNVTPYIARAFICSHVTCANSSLSSLVKIMPLMRDYVNSLVRLTLRSCRMDNFPLLIASWKSGNSERRGSCQRFSFARL